MGVFLNCHMPGVGLMVRVVGFGSEGPEFKSRSAVELIPGVVNSACHPSLFGEMSTSIVEMHQPHSHAPHQ